METAVWMLAGLVFILAILVVVLAIRRTGNADLKQASEYLLTLAEERFKAAAQSQNADLDTKKQLIDQQVQQVKTELEKVATLVNGIEKDRQAKFTELATNIKTLGEQTTSLASATITLRQALASPRTRGQWGERIADDILRFAGFIEGVDYQKQATIECAGSRPDFVIRLPKGLHLNMDCKFPLDNYLKALDAPSDTERRSYEQAFLRDVRSRVKEITSREYIDPEGDTVDCVFLLIPNESIYSYVHQADPQLLDYAVQNHVVCCSPLTLFAVLAVIRQAVDNFVLHEKSDEVLRQLGRFNAEWEKFEYSLTTVGDRLASAQKAYEQVIGPRKRHLERPLAELEALRQRQGLEIAANEQVASPDLPNTKTDD